MEQTTPLISFDSIRSGFFESFFELLRFPSISTDPSYSKEVRACCSWLELEFKKSGFKTQIWETSGHPTLFAETKADPSYPTLLIYGHYDVQPIDPPSAWTSPPFTPTIRDGAVYARGAQDNKGQFWYTFQAAKHLLQTNPAPKINLKFVIEGEEETGSSGLQEIMAAKKSDLTADYALIVDCGIPSMQRPAITVGLRGGCLLTVKISGPKFDLHAGQHGGLAKNPNQALVELFAKLHGSAGEVLVPGFYDDIQEIDELERSAIDFSFDAEEYEAAFGIRPEGGEVRLPPNERRWLRPTIEFNGIGGGYVGEGTKGIIPASATGKLSCRLVPGQDPHRVQRLVRDFLVEHSPRGVRVEVELHPGASRAVRTSPRARLTQVCRDTLSEIFALPTCFVLEGWTVPITAKLAEASGADIALVGLALPDDQIHAPNERFSLERLEKGFLWMQKIILSLSSS